MVLHHLKEGTQISTKKIYTKLFWLQKNIMKLKCLVYNKNDIKVNIIPFLFEKNCFSKNLAYKMIIFKNSQVEN